jgi:flagellar basal-body rod modification protein FlgD
MEPIPGVTSASSSKTASMAASADKVMGKDDFLKLLIAQLGAQDPLDPMGAQDFSAQLAQFSGLEQMTNVNTNLEKLQEQEAQSQNTSIINLIGKTVESNGNTISHKSGGSDTLAYSLGGEAESIKIEIYNATGDRVDTVKLGSQPKGKNQVAWDGLNSQGELLAAGNYSFTVKAENFSDLPVQVNTFSSGLVTDVVFGEGENYAIVNGKELPIDSIKRVSITQ